MNTPETESELSSPATPTARSTARLAAVQALYLIASTQADHKTVVQDFLSGRLGGLALTDDPETETETPVQLSDLDAVLFADVVAASVSRLDDIDHMIDANLSADWPKDRLELIVRSILRVAIAEFLATTDVPVKVTISEYVDVAHAFYDGQEPKLVNAVLDKIASRFVDKTWQRPNWT